MVVMYDFRCPKPSIDSRQGLIKSKINSKLDFKAKDFVSIKENVLYHANMKSFKDLTVSHICKDPSLFSSDSSKDISRRISIVVRAKNLKNDKSPTFSMNLYVPARNFTDYLP